MKQIALGLTLSAALAAQISVAAVPVRAAAIAPANPGGASATVQVEAQQIQVNTRAPIPFQPFPLADLRTGKPLAPDTIITLHSGKKMRLMCSQRAEEKEHDTCVAPRRQ